MKSRRSSLLCRAAPVAAGVAIVLAPAVARADEPAPRPAASAASVDPYAVFPLAAPHEKHYVRASLEVGGVLAVGLVDYMLSTTTRGGTTRIGDIRWGLRYDWPVLRDKLIGTGLDLDTNKLATNYVSHPLAGTLYYTAARSNHLSFVESSAFAVLGSTTWEYFGEIREVASINDLIVTPVSGIAIGEPLMQLSGFFRRGKRNFATELASFIFSPMKVINELVDDAEPLAASRTDALGLAADPWHRFTIGAGVAVTSQGEGDATHPAVTYLDERFSADLRVATLPRYAGAGHESRLFDDGNVSGVRFDLGVSRGQLVDARFATSLVPFGYYFRDGRVDARGRLHGHGVLLGLRMGFEYGVHDYDRDRLRPLDIIAIASPIGVALEHRWTRGSLDVRTAIDLSGGIAAVTPLAFSAYRRSHGIDDVLTPVREAGYYHAYAIEASPTLDMGVGALRSTTSLRLDTFRAIVGHDAQEASVASGPAFRDRRSLLQSTIGFVAPGTPWRVALGLQHAFREGSVGSVRVSRGESSASASVGVEF